MRVICLLEYIQLLLHEIDQDLVLAYMSFAHSFHCTNNSSLRIETLSDLSEGAFAEDASDLVLVQDAISVFETFEEAELEHFFVAMLIGLCRAGVFCHT